MKLLLIALISLTNCSGQNDKKMSPDEAARAAGTISEQVQLNPDMPLETLYMRPDNWWNLDISQAPVDSESDAFIAWLAEQKSSIGPGRLHPDMTPRFGIPYCTVPGTQPKVPVVFTAYPEESDQVGYPIPEEATYNPLFIEAQGSKDGDRHLIIVDRDNWFLYELVQVKWTGEQWEANCGAVFDLATNKRRPEGWTSTDAAGLAVLPGLVRYDEVYGPRPAIKHAFRVAVRRSNGYVWPASHGSGDTEGAPPMGARFRLKASKDISGYPPEIQKIFQAMKTYGLIVADNGGNMYVTGTMDQRWDNDILNPAFHSLHVSDFEVIERGWGKTE